VSAKVDLVGCRESETRRAADRQRKAERVGRATHCGRRASCANLRCGVHDARTRTGHCGVWRLRCRQG